MTSTRGLVGLLVVLLSVAPPVTSGATEAASLGPGWHAYRVSTDGDPVTVRIFGELDGASVLGVHVLNPDGSQVQGYAESFRGSDRAQIATWGGGESAAQNVDYLRTDEQRWFGIAGGVNLAGSLVSGEFVLVVYALGGIVHHEAALELGGSARLLGETFGSTGVFARARDFDGVGASASVIRAGVEAGAVMTHEFTLNHSFLGGFASMPLASGVGQYTLTQGAAVHRCPCYYTGPAASPLQPGTVVATMTGARPSLLTTEIGILYGIDLEMP